MTYPQQRGQHGGYPQPGQYGGYQQPGPGQYGQFGGYGRPPQKKNNAAVVVVVLVAVLVLAGVGITGFVAPGFFLGDDKESAGGSGIEQFAGTLAEAANDQDKSALGDLKCADATDSVDEAITLIGQTGGAELSETKEIAKDKYVVVVTISYQGTSAPFAATVVKDGNGLCWQDFAPGSGPAGGGDAVPEPPSPGGSDEGDSGPDSGPADSEAFVEEFLTRSTQRTPPRPRACTARTLPATRSSTT
jgi:hypothetical protein